MGNISEIDKSYILNAITNAYDYRLSVIIFETPAKFLSKNLKGYTKEDYERDLENLKKFDINLLWNKSFWNIGVSSSIAAYAEPHYSKLRKLLNQ